MDNQEKFEFTYSAKEQAEVSRIRKKYVPSENKMELLHRLDAGVTEKANMAAIMVGVIGTLIMGIGMCCALVWQERWLIPGIIIGIMGMMILAVAHPVYQSVFEKEREKVAPVIIRLTDELMK